MGFDGLFWIVFLRGLLLAFVSGGVGIAFLLAFSVGVCVIVFLFGV